MTPAQFITGLFGEGWTESQLPVLLEALRKSSDDAIRYHAIRDAAVKGDGFVASQEELRQFDIDVDKARQSGLI